MTTHTNKYSKETPSAVVTGGHEPNDREAQKYPHSVQYQLQQVIGKGSYGVVYKAMNKKTKKVVAIKEINYDSDEELNEIMIEIDLLKNLNHVNIVKYHGFMQKSSRLYIILEYAARGSLKTLISRRLERCLSEEETKTYIKQTLNGLNYLHEQGVIHRDIKAANLLLDSNNIVKLADFGVSTKVGNTAMTLAGSLNWMAPEIITSKGASPFSDIWSLGATVVELMTGNPPFHNLIDINIYYAIENDTYYPPLSLPELCRDFLDKCFQKSMFQRPSARDLLRHPWLATAKEPQGLTKLEKLTRFKERSTELDKNWDDDFCGTGENVQAAVQQLLRARTPVRSPLRHPGQLGDKDQKFELPRIGSNGSLDGAWRLDPSVISTPTPNAMLSGGSPHMGLSAGPATLNSSAAAATATSADSSQLLLAKLKRCNISRQDVRSIISNCNPNDIVETVLEMLHEQKHTDGEQKNAITATLRLLLDYDSRSADSKIRKVFVNYGGMALILDNEPLVSHCFLNDTHSRMDRVTSLTSGGVSTLELLIQMGVMLPHNIKHYVSNPGVYFQFVYKYLDMTSMKFWYNWCAENLDPKMLVDHLTTDRKAQSILVKLASFDNSLANTRYPHWVLRQVLPLLIAKIPSFSNITPSGNNIQFIYVILKSLTFTLELSHSGVPTGGNSGLNLSIGTTSSSNTNNGSFDNTPLSPYGLHRITSTGDALSPGVSVLRATYSNPNSPAKQEYFHVGSNLRRSYMGGSVNPHSGSGSSNGSSTVKGTTMNLVEVNDSIAQLVLPTEFNQWILSLLSDTETLILSNDLHLWKYFTRICSIVSHLDPDFIMLLYDNSRLFKLVNLILKELKETDGENSKKLMQSILRQWLMLFLQLSRHPYVPTENEKLLYRTLISFTKFSTFYVSTLEIILNLLQHNTTATATVGDDNDKFTVLTSYRENLIRKIKAGSILPRIFYDFNPDDINFSTFLNQYIKFCSLHLYRGLCDELLSDAKFVDRLKLFFRMYENSLLIQIDLLKFLKILFINCDGKSQVNKERLDATVAFLDKNWSSNEDEEQQQQEGDGSYENRDSALEEGKNSLGSGDSVRHGGSSRQVGKNSMLIIKLCEDIRQLRLDH